MKGERSPCFPAAAKTCNTHAPFGSALFPLEIIIFFRIKYMTEKTNKHTFFTVHVLSKLKRSEVSSKFDLFRLKDLF